MRGSFLPARLMVAALVAVAVAAVSVSGALATNSTNSANGLSVTASLSPDAVTKGQIVSQLASVTNVSRSAEDVSIRIIGPLATASPVTFSATLQPGATFTKGISFPASALSPGTHTLTVVAVNRQTNTATSATASIVVN